MDKNNATYNPDKCLSAQQLKAYVRNLLDNEEKCKVDEHLEKCDFCKDAIEGYAYLEENNLETKVASLNKRIRKQSAKYYFSKGNVRFNKNFHQWIAFASIAASIIIILGTFYYLNYSWNRYSKQLAEEYIIKNKAIETASFEKKEAIKQPAVVPEKDIVKSPEQPLGLEKKSSKKQSSKQQKKSALGKEEKTVYDTSENPKGNLEALAIEEAVSEQPKSLKRTKSVARKEQAIQKELEYTQSAPAKQMQETNLSVVIAPVYKKGEEYLINKIQEKLRINNIDFPDENIVIRFTVTKNGTLQQIRIKTKLGEKEEALLVALLKKHNHWQPAMQNDQLIDYEIEIVIPRL